MKRFLMSGVFAFALSACMTMPNDTPEGRLYNATATYGATVKISLIYETLLRCAAAITTEAQAAVQLCSTVNAVASIRNADNAAFSALEILGAGVPPTPAIEALRALIAIDRARLHSDSM